MVFPNAWKIPQRQTCSICPKIYSSIQYAKVSRINQSRNVYKRTTQWFLRCCPNEFSVEECLTEIYTKFDIPLERKERPLRIHLLRTFNRFLRRKHDISGLFWEQNCSDFCDRWLLAWEMWSRVRYIPVHKTVYRYQRHCDENLRDTLDNWKINRFRKKSTSATHNYFMVLILSSVYSPAKPVKSSTSMVVEVQEPTKQIYPSFQTLPNNAPNTIWPV